VFLPPAGVRLKDPTVNIRDVDEVLQRFLVTAGLVHLHLFDEMLTVTSGKDGVHAPGSKHAVGRAVDLRISDLGLAEQPVFILYLRVLCARFHLNLFDESNLPYGGHVHIEIAG
jgi:hypothetical protein